mmetsp:Transcript_1850/g.3867  ORF Transcript_1850/g.3867 Transcript_1850/m.3867 type:complete len:452 (+) Transcript_1850:197-1552(+)
MAMAFRRSCTAVLVTVVAVSAQGEHQDPAQVAFVEGLDDECTADADGDCALSALQMKAKNQQVAQEATSSEERVDETEAHASGIWHYALPCWYHCGSKAGFCEDYCGPAGACCRYNNYRDPPECHTVRFFPILTGHTCTTASYRPSKGDANKLPVPSPTPGRPPVPSPAGSPERLIYASHPDLLKPSTAPLYTYYMYRVQSDENYSPENQNMGNLAGMLWYLHNEIVVHPSLQRSGTFFATPKTRVEKYKVSTRATQPLYDKGMNFGVVNAFDLTKCTGPFACYNFERYGYSVGCENWEGGAASFPHGQWVNENKYPGATWYALPGPCSSKGMGAKTEACMQEEPGGACPDGVTEPTGEGNCTYVYEKVGEISIDELEGLTDPSTFKAMSYQEYNKQTDRGYGMSFWNDKRSVKANQDRIAHALDLFKTKYPDHPDLPDPICDFNRWTFYK